MTVRRMLRALGMTLLLALLLCPLYWMLLASLTPEARIFGAPALLPQDLVLDHYRALFAGRDFWTPIRNSLFVGGATTILSVGLGAPCAYVLARMPFRGRTLTLAVVLENLLVGIRTDFLYGGSARADGVCKVLRIRNRRRRNGNVAWRRGIGLQAASERCQISGR